MEKYYCDHCRLLYDILKRCDICGALAEKKIIIEIQNQEKDRPY
jgi:hypothetical protein